MAKVLTGETPELGNKTVEDILDNFDFEDIAELTGKKQNVAASKLINELSSFLSILEKDNRRKKMEIKRATLKINATDPMIALKQLKKEYRTNEKNLDAATGILMGGIQMIKACGIKLDPETVKFLKEQKLMKER